MTPTQLRNNQEGWALVTAVALMTIMLMIGLGVLATVDNSTSQTRVNRERESSLNLTEGVLYAQAFTLARKWPAPAKPTRFPPVCESANATDGLCPNRDNLAVSQSKFPGGAAFADLDFKADASWTTRVRDNYGPLSESYNPDPAIRDGRLVNPTTSVACPLVPCSYDFNNDSELWVEARGEVRGEPRRIVAKMKLEVIQESVPRVGIATGALALTNNGAASFDVSGASATTTCPPDEPSPQGGTCTNYKSNAQVAPKPIQGVPQPFMSASQIERFRERAGIDGTYYDEAWVTSKGCPPLKGSVVFIEKLPALNCDYKGADGATCNPAPPAYSPTGMKVGMSSPCVNQMTAPGIVIVRCGGFTTSGDWTYVGIVYFVNGSDGACTPVRGPADATKAECPKGGQKDPSKVVFDGQGGGAIWGAIAADGGACIQLGSNSQMQVLFDDNVFRAVSSYGTVGLVQNTWRELPPGKLP